MVSLRFKVGQYRCLYIYQTIANPLIRHGKLEIQVVSNFICRQEVIIIISK